MEYGLRLTDPTAVPADPRTAFPAAWRDLLPAGPAVALYFGTEFCEDRLPDAAEAAALCAAARTRGLEPTLATPLVARDCQPAVVFNDWGVLGLLRARYAHLPRRAGRLVNRSLRDPRGYRDAPDGSATHDASRYARVRTLLREMGVAALETDADLEGGFLGDGADAPRPLGRALHLPYTYAASGRGCPLKAALYPEGGGFAKAFADACPAPCRGKPLAVHRPDTALPHWRAGNTLFYELPHGAAAPWLGRADRIVVHEAPTP
jgi:hypothetical protein